MTKINSFDDQSMKKIASAVARLKAAQENTHRQVRGLIGGPDQNAAQVRTAITATTAAVPEYPTSGCHLPFIIHDLDFDPTVTNSCPDTDKRAWEDEHTGRAIDGEYIEEGTEILFVDVPSPDGRRFWIFPAGSSPAGTVLFTLKEDRSREVDGAGKFFGQAAALVEATVGDVPVNVGDTINVIFGGRRWLGAVGPGFNDKGCEGIADYYGGNNWIVKECQELTQGFWFTTKDDRTPLYPDEDVELSGVQKNIGHANADFPAVWWKQIGGNDPLTVRFHGLTFPYSFEGAVGYAVLDIAIDNTTSNSTMRYLVVQVDQGALINEVFHDAFCPGGEPSIQTHAPATWYPFSQTWPSDLISSAVDRMELASKDGGMGYTAYNDTLNAHVLLNTEHAPYTFLMPPSQGCGVPQQLSIQALTCESPEAASGFALDYALTEAALVYEETDSGGSGSGQECSSPKLKFNYKRRPFWYCGDESALVSSTINLEQILLTSDVSDDGDCIVQEQTHVIVFGSCDTITENVFCTTDEQCESSGS